MQRTMAREGTEDREFLIYSLIYSNKLAYLQLITVLVCRNSPLKSESSKDTCEDILLLQCLLSMLEKWKRAVDNWTTANSFIKSI